MRKAASAWAEWPEPAQEDIAEVANAYAETVGEAQLMDLTTASPQTIGAEIRNAYPFHPGIRDLYARFKENPGFQQTRALIRIMRVAVERLWNTGRAQQLHLIGAQDLDFRQPAMMSELRQINSSLEAPLAHDIATEAGDAVAEEIDGAGRSDAQDAAKLIFLSSLSQAVSPTLGLTRSEIVQYLAAPGRQLDGIRAAIDELQARAWYLHTTAHGALLFKNVENLNAKHENYAGHLVKEARETELRTQLKAMFKPKLGACYQEVREIPALDEVQLSQDKVTLVIFRPSATGLQEVRDFYDHQQYKNRVLFLTSEQAPYDRVLLRAAYLHAIDLILGEFAKQGVREDDPQHIEATGIKTRDQSSFYMACREAFQSKTSCGLGGTRSELGRYQASRGYRRLMGLAPSDRA